MSLYTDQVSILSLSSLSSSFLDEQASLIGGLLDSREESINKLQTTAMNETLFHTKKVLSKNEFSYPNLTPIPSALQTLGITEEMNFQTSALADSSSSAPTPILFPNLLADNENQETLKNFKSHIKSSDENQLKVKKDSEILKERRRIQARDSARKYRKNQKAMLDQLLSEHKSFVQLTDKVEQVVQQHCQTCPTTALHSLEKSSEQSSCERLEQVIIVLSKEALTAHQLAAENAFLKQQLAFFQLSSSKPA